MRETRVRTTIEEWLNYINVIIQTIFLGMDEKGLFLADQLIFPQVYL